MRLYVRRDLAYNHANTVRSKVVEMKEIYELQENMALTIRTGRELHSGLGNELERTMRELILSLRECIDELSWKRDDAIALAQARMLVAVTEAEFTDRATDLFERYEAVIHLENCLKQGEK